MDLLCQAYKDDDGDEDVNGKPIILPNSLSLHNPPLSKRKQPPLPESCYYPPPCYNNYYYQNNYSSYSNQTSYSSSYEAQLHPSTFTAASVEIEGRYISKRERAILSSSSGVSHPLSCNTTTGVSLVSVVGSLADSDLPSDILESLRSRYTDNANKIAGRPSILLNGHTNAVNSIQWSKNHAHLLASAGMDQTIIVWNVWSENQKKACVLKNHNAAIKDVKWTPDGLSLLSCGYDSTSRLVDVEKGVETQTFKDGQVVEAIKFHPKDSNLFLSGGSKGILRLWDIRSGNVACKYIKGLGPILDIEFSADGKQFLSSTDTSMNRISEDSIIVWDVQRQIPLSNQVYTEAYTCPCIRYHPYDSSFLAQSNGNYIAIFSSRPSFKLNKYRRYEGHGVWGYPIKFNFSLGGSELASGSSDGSVYFYDYKSSRFVRKIKAFGDACIDVAFHPLVSNVIAACSWNGEVSVITN